MPRVASVVALLLLLGVATATVAAHNTISKNTPTLWSNNIVPIEQPYPPTMPSFIGKHVIVMQDCGTIVSMDASTGEVQCTYTGLNSSSEIINQISVIPMQAVAVWGTMGVVGLDISTGAELWINTFITPYSMLATEEVLLVNTNASILMISPLTGQTTTYPLNAGLAVQPAIQCGNGRVCWMQFPVNSDGNGQAVVFDIKSGKVLQATTLPITSSIYVQHFRATATHLIVVYEQYFSIFPLGVAIAAVDLANGEIAWTSSMPLPAQVESGDLPTFSLSTGEDVVSLVANLPTVNLLGATLNLLVFDERSGDVVVNWTMTQTTTPTPTFTHIHDGRIWIGQVQTSVVNVTAFDQVTGQVMSTFTAPALAANQNAVYVTGGASGPRWLLPNQAGVTVWDGLTGAFVSSSTAIPGIWNAAQTQDGKAILTTSASVVALQL